MKIIFGATSFDQAKHAQQVLRSLDKHESEARRVDEMRLVGINRGLARRQTVCDDCGQSYWVKWDDWTEHLGCPGPPKKASTGF